MQTIKINQKKVFPTPVGVFLDAGTVVGKGTGLPHARGGVSGPFTIEEKFIESSPRPCGCF